MKKSVSEMLDFLRSQKATEVFWDDKNVEYEIKKLNLERYVAWRYEGYIETLNIYLKSIKGRTRPKILELGALPYIFTGFILKNETIIELYLAGAPSNDPNRNEGKVVIENPKMHLNSHELPLALFNVEQDSFPYNDEMFDIVLCCEILEHLPFSPSHMLCEINRIFKPGGELILTTPNILGIGKILQLLKSRNIYAPLSIQSIYGRHNREYTADEVSTLFRLSNFQVLDIIFANPIIPRDAYHNGIIGSIKYYLIKSLYHLSKAKYLRKRGDFLLFRGKKIGSPVYAKPEYLYGDVADTRYN